MINRLFNSSGSLNLFLNILLQGQVLIACDTSASTTTTTSPSPNTPSHTKGPPTQRLPPSPQHPHLRPRLHPLAILGRHPRHPSAQTAHIRLLRHRPLVRRLPPRCAGLTVLCAGKGHPARCREQDAHGRAGEGDAADICGGGAGGLGC